MGTMTLATMRARIAKLEREIELHRERAQSLMRTEAKVRARVRRLEHERDEGRYNLAAMVREFGRRKLRAQSPEWMALNLSRAFLNRAEG